MKKISPIKQILEEDSEDRSRNTPQTKRQSSYTSKNSIDMRQDDNDNFLKLIKTQNHQDKSMEKEKVQAATHLDLDEPKE
jgi:hypothetical protein